MPKQITKTKFIFAISKNEQMVCGQPISKYENEDSFVAAWEKFFKDTQRSFGCGVALSEAKTAYHIATPFSKLQETVATCVFDLVDQKLFPFVEEIARDYKGTGLLPEKMASNFLKQNAPALS